MSPTNPCERKATAFGTCLYPTTAKLVVCPSPVMLAMNPLTLALTSWRVVDPIVRGAVYHSASKEVMSNDMLA
jgi:hypothetical protein